MWIKDFFVSVWSVLLISLSVVLCSGWKPIAPPAEYYATKPTTCVSDCEPKYNNPFSNEGGLAAAETQLKTTLLSKPIAFSQDKNYQQSNKKLDLEIYKPTEVSFFPQEDEKVYSPPLTTYQDAYGKSPTSYYSFKLYGAPQKPTKTIYYGNLDLIKPKLTNNVKYYKPNKQNEGKVFNPANFVDNEVGAYRPLKNNVLDEHCSLYKISFRQDHYYQYVQYKVHMPELKEFTICLWSRFHNHSHDQSLFSYGVKNHRQAIYMWVSNLNEPGFFNLKILGQPVFRLNYPIKLYKWYHTCQSWNGHTGEWQVWVDSHRIARGFHNLLVGHKIPGGGVAISGQDHRYFGKGFREFHEYSKGSGGLEGEITMLQLYKVALTAGKAYNDHTHHHSHYQSTTTEPPDIPTEETPTTPDHPFLENGQLKTHINVLELAEALKKKKFQLPEVDVDHEHDHEHDYNHDHDHDHYIKTLTYPYVSHLAPLAVHGNTINFLGLPPHAVFKRNDESEVGNETVLLENDEKKIKVISGVSDQVRVEKIKFPDDEHQNSSTVLDKSSENVTLHDDVLEETTQESTRVGKRLKRQNTNVRIVRGNIKPRYPVYRLRKKGNNRRIEASKRLIQYVSPYDTFGTVGLINHEIHSSYGEVPSAFGFEYSHTGHHDFGGLNEGDDHTEDDQENVEKPLKKETELAEGEVRRVLEICSGCHQDPFRKVVVISWRSTPKKIFSGALFLKAKSDCHNF